MVFIRHIILAICVLFLKIFYSSLFIGDHYRYVVKLPLAIVFIQAINYLLTYLYLVYNLLRWLWCRLWCEEAGTCFRSTNQSAHGTWLTDLCLTARSA